MFNSMSLNEPGYSDWNIDIRTTSHLHAEAVILNSMSDKNINSSSSILVGDGSSIPVTIDGNTILSLPNAYVLCTLKMF